ncbi:MAG: type II secretion system F family protein [Thermoplasmatota archaeon]
MAGDRPSIKTARKQIVDRRKVVPDFKEIKTSSDTEKTKKITIYTISIILGVAFLLLGVLTMPFGPFSVVKEEYEDTYQYMSDDETRLYMKEGPLPLNLTFNTTGKWVKDEVSIEFHSFFMLAFIFGFGPVSFYEVRKRKKIDKVESRLSDFLRDISETMRAGQTLHEAIKTSAGGEYGALTREIEKMALQVSWGVSTSRALLMFSERVNTPLVKRAVTLINEASSAGGNVSNVIDAAAKDTRELQIMKVTRATEMSMYTYVIAIAFLVFLVVIAIMFMTFMPRMEELSASYSESGSGSSQAPGGFDPTSVDFGLMKYLFFSAAAIQAIGDGVVGGLMSSGRLSKGFQMASIFALITWLIFDFLLL